MLILICSKFVVPLLRLVSGSSFVALQDKKERVDKRNVKVRSHFLDVDLQSFWFTCADIELVSPKRPAMSTWLEWLFRSHPPREPEGARTGEQQPELFWIRFRSILDLFAQSIPNRSKIDAKVIQNRSEIDPKSIQFFSEVPVKARPH